MIWKDATLLKIEKIGEDELGNDLTTYASVGDVKMRFSPWSNTEKQLEGREVTENSQKYIIPSDFPFPACVAVRVDGVIRKINKVINLTPRFTGIIVENYKQGLTEEVENG